MPLVIFPSVCYIVRSINGIRDYTSNENRKQFVPTQTTIQKRNKPFFFFLSSLIEGVKEFIDPANELAGDC